MTDDSAIRLIGALRRLTGAFTEMGYRLGEIHGMGRNDTAALIIITESAEAGTSIGTVELARRIGMTAPSATVLVDRLVAAGLVARQHHHTDGRRVVLTPTASAREAGRAHFGAMNEQILRMLRTHPPDELRVAADLLEQTADLAATCTHPTRPGGL